MQEPYWTKIEQKSLNFQNTPHITVSVNLLTVDLIIPPPQNVGGAYTGFALSRQSVFRSVGRSVSNSCPLYNSFTNGRISIKLEWHIHLN